MPFVGGSIIADHPKKYYRLEVPTLNKSLGFEK